MTTEPDGRTLERLDADRREPRVFCGGRGLDLQACSDYPFCDAHAGRLEPEHAETLYQNALAELQAFGKAEPRERLIKPGTPRGGA